MLVPSRNASVSRATATATTCAVESFAVLSPFAAAIR